MTLVYTSYGDVALEAAADIFHMWYTGFRKGMKKGACEEILLI